MSMQTQPVDVIELAALHPRNDPSPSSNTATDLLVLTENAVSATRPARWGGVREGSTRF